METLKSVLQKRIFELFGVEKFEVDFADTPDNMQGDVACNAAMRLAKILQKNPREIANDLVGKLQGELPNYEFSVAGAGFINITFPNEYYTENIERLAENFKGEVQLNNYAGKVVLCEFSDPNPFKVLHVGHFYTSVVGDAISRLYEFAGADVKRLNFGGDVGLHVAKTMYEILRTEDDFLNDAALSLDEKAEKIGQCYVAGTRAYEDDDGAKAEITKINKEIYEISEKDLHDSS